MPACAWRDNVIQVAPSDNWGWERGVEKNCESGGGFKAAATNVNFQSLSLRPYVGESGGEVGGALPFWM